MWLDKLPDGKNFIATIAAWRDAWNRNGGVADHLRSLRIIPGEGIQVQRYANGTKISATATTVCRPQETVSGYRGPFQIVKSDTDPNKYQVVDGIDQASGVAGSSDLGDIPAGDVVGAAGLVYLVATFTYDAVNGGYMVSYQYTTNAPVLGSANVVIGEIRYNKIYQYFTGGYIVWRTRCFL